MSQTKYKKSQSDVKQTVKLVLRHNRQTMWQLSFGLSLFFMPATAEAPAQLQLRQQGFLPEAAVVTAVRASLREALPGQPDLEAQQQMHEGIGYVTFRWQLVQLQL